MSGKLKRKYNNFPANDWRMIIDVATQVFIDANFHRK